MLELKRKILRVKLDDKEFELNYPKPKDVSALTDRGNVESAKDNIELSKNFLVNLGMTEEIFDGLDFDHIEEIITELLSKKK